MKEDYLWEKTGSDPAIEKLESTLRAFSYEESAQPVLPVAIVPQRRSFMLRFAPLAFAMAGLAFVAVVWGAWMKFSPVSDQGTQISTVMPMVVTPSALVPGKPAPPYIQKTIAPKAPETVQFTRTIARRPSKAHESHPVTIAVAANGKPKFTKEEIYAYDQLVLALSITSDKLGQVREKAIGMQNNFEEK